jgi:hypothetical protein
LTNVAVFVLCSAILSFLAQVMVVLPHMRIQGFVLVEVTNEDNKMILEFHEHVNFYESVIFKVSLLLSWFLIISSFMQALVLSRNKAAKWMMEVAQHDRVIELQQENAELKVERA